MYVPYRVAWIPVGQIMIMISEGESLHYEYKEQSGWTDHE